MTARILLADDSSTMRKIIVRSLAPAGIATIVEAADGDELVTLFEPGKFDLVLTDWRMPGRTGMEGAEIIRRRDAKVPIVLMATELEQYPAAEATAAGITDRLTKPFSAEALCEIIEKHCPHATSVAAPRRRSAVAKRQTA